MGTWGYVYCACLSATIRTCNLHKYYKCLIGVCVSSIIFNMCRSLTCRQRYKKFGDSPSQLYCRHPRCLPVFDLSVSCLPFVFNLLSHSIILSGPPSARSLSGSALPTVIWQLYEFYTLTECNYVRLISWNGSSVPWRWHLMTFDKIWPDSRQFI